MFKELKNLYAGLSAAILPSVAGAVYSSSPVKRRRQPEPINYGLRQEIADHNAKVEAAKREKLAAKLARRSERLK